jgi:putative sigma-54 modulation protein
MEITIDTRNVDLTPRLQSYVERKTSRLDRYMPNMTEVRVDLEAQSARSAVERQVAQITVRDARGTILRAEERSSDMFAAIDAVIDKLYRQIKRYRGKSRQGRRGNHGEDVLVGEPLPIAEDEEEAEAAEPVIARRKQFTLRPMMPEEAIDQMELLGHTFYVLFNLEDEAVNVVYRRHDGSYGLLQPFVD